MHCAFPVAYGSVHYPCGQCIPCRVNYQRKKVTRLLLENKEHTDSAFLTLTYSDDFVPLGWASDGTVAETLNPDHLKRFFRRLRVAIDHPYRYFAVGEYGTKTMRPHYHAILFGIGQSWLEHRTIENHRRTNLEAVWGKGHVSTGELNEQRMRYCAQYTVKKYNKREHLLCGRPPEFMRCSRRPGIGMNHVKILADYYRTKGGEAALLRDGDVSAIVDIDGKHPWPLDYYFLTQLRKELGLPTLNAGKGPIDEWGDPLEPIEEMDPVDRELKRKQAEAAHWKAMRKNHGTL